MKRIHLSLLDASPAGPELRRRGRIVGDYLEISHTEFELACAPHIHFGLGDLVALIIHRLRLDALARRLGLKACNCASRRARMNQIVRNLFGFRLHSRVRRMRSLRVRGPRVKSQQLVATALRRPQARKREETP